MNSSAEKLPVVNELIEPVNRYFHNPVAAKIVGILKDTWVTADQVTYASVFLGLVSAYIFSVGTMQSFFVAGVILEVVLILDCVDGQLARAKGCASDWGRLLDGIAGYVIYLAVLFGIMIGLDSHFTALVVIGVLTILRAISYDYCKLTMITMIQKGYDGNQKEISDTYLKISESPSSILKVYYYYLQLQQYIFCGHFTTFSQYKGESHLISNDDILTPDQRKTYRGEISTLMTVWSWNGVDLPLFLLVLFSVLGVLEVFLSPLAFMLALQFVLTMICHRMQARISL